MSKVVSISLSDPVMCDKSILLRIKKQFFQSQTGSLASAPAVEVLASHVAPKTGQSFRLTNQPTNQGKVKVPRRYANSYLPTYFLHHLAAANLLFYFTSQRCCSRREKSMPAANANKPPGVWSPHAYIIVASVTRRRKVCFVQ